MEEEMVVVKEEVVEVGVLAGCCCGAFITVNQDQPAADEMYGHDGEHHACAQHVLT